MFEGLALVSISALVLLGVRHALDVDHITAIDNLVRMYISSRVSRLVGTAFAAGHSLAVLLEIVLVVGVLGSFTGTSWIGYWGGLAGVIALGAIGLLNFYSMRRWGRTGSSIVANGVLARFGQLGPLSSAFIMGIVFGLGFDSASQISVIALSSAVSILGGLAASLSLLVPFATAMAAVDTLDSVALRFAFASIASTGGFRLMSYALSLTALLVAFSSLYGMTHSLGALPEWVGPALATTVIGSSLVYALERRNRVIRRTLGFP